MRGPQAPPRNRPPAGGGGAGIWGDGFSTRSSAHRPRAGYGVATDTTAGMGGRQNLDALRANRLRQQGVADPEESVGGFTAGKALVVILLMLVLGAGGAYVYFKITTPPVHSNIGTGSSSTPSGFMPHHTSADFALTDWRQVSR